MKRILHIHTSITPTSWSSMNISSPKRFQINKGIKPYWLCRVPSHMLESKNHYYAILVLHTQKQTPMPTYYTRDMYSHQYITPVSSETDLEKYQTPTKIENTVSEDDYETVNHELRVSALDYDDIFYDDYILLGQHHT